MQMTQSACRMSVDSGRGGWAWGVAVGGGGLFDRDSERNQATNSSVITGTAPPWGNEGTLAIGCFVCGLITVGLSNELYSLSLHKKYSVPPPPLAFVVHQDKSESLTVKRASV